MFTDHFFFFSKCEVSSFSESPEEEDADLPDEDNRDVWASEAGSDDATPPSSAISPVEDSWTGSPRKRTQTLPSFSGPTTAREPGWERWSRFQESFNESDEKTLSEDIFKILDLEKVTIFSGGQKGENERAEVQQERGLDKTGTDGVVRQTDTKAHVQSTGLLPEQKLSLGRDKPTAVNETAQQQSNAEKPENTDTAHIIKRYGPNHIYICSFLAHH